MNTLTIQRLPQTTALMGVILSLLLLLTGLPAAAERTVTYFHSDAAGSVVAASNAAGDLLWRKHYAPYGQQLGGSDTTEPTAYAGHVHDQDIGLTYMKARYYDPQAGRFLGVDPAGVSESNPLSFNRYAYANNNPYKYVDPDGRVGKLINGGIKLIKHGGNPKKAGKEFIADVADSVTTLVDPSASAVDKGLAAFDLVSPVGTQDIKKLADATKSGQKLLPAPKVRGNPNRAPENGTIFVDSKGNAIITPPGGRITGSPDGKFIQARDANNKMTGVRKDGGHNPANHPDPRAQQPHGHVPGVTNPDGTPWLPIKQ